MSRKEAGGWEEAMYVTKKLSSYQPRLRKRGWWWNIFLHARNIAVVASHKIHKRLNNEMNLSHHDFGVEVAESMLLSQQISSCQGKHWLDMLRGLQKLQELTM